MGHRMPRSGVYYDIEDENGRNYSFSNEEVRERTASITIDVGVGTQGLSVQATIETF